MQLHIFPDTILESTATHTVKDIFISKLSLFLTSIQAVTRVY